jgi:long-chain fatty acid transport protein
MKSTGEKRLIFSIVLFLLGAGIPARASLFTVDIGARAAALGGAFIARADDPSSLYINPAGMAFTTGFRLKPEVILGRESLMATAPDTGKAYLSRSNRFRIFGATTWRFAKRAAAGLGVFTPHGFGTDWPSTWAGNQMTINASLSHIVIRPALSVEVLPGLALGAGVDFIFANMRWAHYFTFNIPNYPLSEDLDILSRNLLTGHGVGWVAGMLWKVTPAFRLGARYKPRVSLTLKGSDVFTLPADTPLFETLPDPLRPAGISFSEFSKLYFKEQHIASRVTIPEEIAGGIMLVPKDGLSLYFDAQWTRWSQLTTWEVRSVNTGLDANPDWTPQYEEFYGMPLTYLVQGPDLALKDGWRFGGGAEYLYKRRFAFRAGFSHEGSTLGDSGPNPVYPEFARNIVSLGFGYEGSFYSVYTEEPIGEFTFDIFVRHNTAAGTSIIPGFGYSYDDNQWVIGVGFAIKL